MMRQTSSPSISDQRTAMLDHLRLLPGAREDLPERRAEAYRAESRALEAASLIQSQLAERHRQKGKRLKADEYETAAARLSNLAAACRLVGDGISPEEAVERHTTRIKQGVTGTGSPQSDQAIDTSQSEIAVEVDHARMFIGGFSDWHGGRKLPKGDIFVSGSRYSIERNWINKPFNLGGHRWITVGGFALRVVPLAEYEGTTFSFQEKAPTFSNKMKYAVHTPEELEGIRVRYGTEKLVITGPKLVFSSHVFGSTDMEGRDMFIPKSSIPEPPDPYAKETEITEETQSSKSGLETRVVEAELLNRIHISIRPDEIAHGFTSLTFWHKDLRYAIIGGLIEAGNLYYTYIRTMRVVTAKEYEGATFSYSYHQPRERDESFEGCALASTYEPMTRLIMTGPVIEFRPDRQESRVVEENDKRADESAPKTRTLP